MKNLYKLLLPILVIFYNNLVASPIDSLQASKVAANFIVRYAEKYEGLAFAHKDANVDNTVMYYVFNLKNAKGYVIVVADDACFPILGYSTEGNFDANDLPIQLNKWLWHRAKEIAYIKKQGFEANEEIKQEWKKLQNPTAIARTEKTEGVNPLITTKWNQSPYYNDLCPYDRQAKERAVTGCVATAMAQIMKYHNHPQKGQGIYSYTHEIYGRLSADFGSTTYNWASMTNNVTSRNTAVATLMYHCGVSVNMTYGVQSSGADGAVVVSPALTKYFGYATSVKTVERKNYTEASWISLLKSELDAKRPMYYEGLGQGGNNGHAFVCDGYNDNDFFHFNWGWGGKADGHYSIRALNPEELGTGAGFGEYNSGQKAVIGIQPAPNSSVNLQLNKKITVNPSPIGFGTDVTVSFNIANRGSSVFQGDYAVALFDKDFEFISFIGTPLPNRTLNAGYTYTNDLSFTQKSVFLSEGDYYVAAYFKEPQKEWQILTQPNFENPLKVSVSNVVADLTMYGTPIKANTDPIFQTQAFEVTFNVANFSKTTNFEGDLALSLYDLEGKFIKEIETKTNLALGTEKTFSNPLVFKTNGLDIPVGTYILAPSYKSKGSSSFYVLAGYKDDKGIYPNLVRVVVAAPPLVADKFEVNNQESQAFTLPISFTNNLAVVNTESSNLHIGTDIDHYKLNLPSGFDYEITARLHDKDNSANGKTYTVDALFGYKIGTGNYSDAFDVSIGENNSKLAIINGGTMIFKVAPYFSGFTGTYLLDIQVSRKQVITPNITITSPKNGDRWQNTTLQQITWTDNIDENVRIDLLRSDNTIVQSITNSTPSNGSFSWTVPDLAEGNYKIGITSTTNNSVQALSPIFTIFKAVQSIITITSPKNGDRWQTTTTQQITWTDNIDENVRIDLLRSDNTIVQSITNSTPSNGSFSWTVPDLAEGNYKIGMMSTTNNSVQAISPLFSIFKIVTGIEDELFSGQIKVYPNPTSKILLVQFPQNAEIESIRLLNPLGQEILQTKNKLGEILSLDLSAYPSGLYYLYVLSDKKVGIKKIVLNK